MAEELSLFGEPRLMRPRPPANRPRDRYSDRQMPSEREGTNKDYRRGTDDEGHHRYTPPHPLGAPPLDWWVIDDS